MAVGQKSKKGELEQFYDKKKWLHRGDGLYWSYGGSIPTNCPHGVWVTSNVAGDPLDYFCFRY